jgi:hypothetical protein
MYSDEIKELVWNKAHIEEGYDPNVWRMDFAGAWIKKDLLDSAKINGWLITPYKPISKGGTDDIKNLLPMNINNSLKKGDNFPKFQTCISSMGEYDRHNVIQIQSWIAQEEDIVKK